VFVLCTALAAGIVAYPLAGGVIADIIGIALALCAIAFIALMFVLARDTEDRRYRKRAL
jgi:hypothetical protein